MRLHYKLANALCATHPKEAAAALEGLEPQQIADILGGSEANVCAKILERLTAQQAAEVVVCIDLDEMRAILAHLDGSVAGGILRRVAEDPRDAILGRLDAGRRAALSRWIGYSEHTAGGMADPDVLALPEDVSVREALRTIRGTRQRAYHYLYILDRDDVLNGVVSMSELVVARPGQLLGSLVRSTPVSLPDRMTAESVIAHPAWSTYRALPVVDRGGRYVGTVRHETVKRLARELSPETAGHTGTAESLAGLFRAGLLGLLESVGPELHTGEETRHG